MKITKFLSVNNGNLGAIARMKQGFQKYIWVTVLRSTLDIVYRCKTNQPIQKLSSNLGSFYFSIKEKKRRKRLK